MTDKIYVIGHVNPDTDTVAAAVGYAWLLHERDLAETIPARAGAVNPQTAWVLKKVGLEAPLLLNDASPRFDSVTIRLDSALPDSPLREAWGNASRTWGWTSPSTPSTSSPRHRLATRPGSKVGCSVGANRASRRPSRVRSTSTIPFRSK